MAEAASKSLSQGRRLSGRLLPGWTPCRPSAASRHSDRVQALSGSIWTPSWIPFYLNQKERHLSRKCKAQVPPCSTPTLPGLSLPSTSCLMMPTDSSAPAHQDPILLAGPSSCKPASPLGLCLCCSLTWRALPLSLSLVAELLHIPQGPACEAPSVCGLS